MLPKTAAPRIVVLKAHRFYGDIICRQIKEYWRNAHVEVFQRGFDALDSIQAVMPDLITAEFIIAELASRTKASVIRDMVALAERT